MFPLPLNFRNVYKEGYDSVPGGKLLSTICIRGMSQFKLLKKFNFHSWRDFSKVNVINVTSVFELYEKKLTQVRVPTTKYKRT